MISMFLTNNFGMLSRRQSQNVFAEWTYAAAVRVPCAVVALVDKSVKTSVRTDQSASRGAAEEETVMATILFPPSVSLSIDDKFVIANINMRVDQIQPHYDVFGKFNHNEVTLEHVP